MNKYNIQANKSLGQNFLIDENVINTAIEKLSQLKESCLEFLSQCGKRQSYATYWLQGYDKHSLNELSKELEDTVAYLSNSDKQLVINKLMDYPVLRSLFFYYPVNNRPLAYVIMALFPVGLTGYWIGLRQQNRLKKDINSIISVSDELINIYGEKS